MLKAKAEKEGGGNLIVFGLSYTNLDMLRKGKPIMIEGKDMGYDFEIMIFAGETEVKMAEMLEIFIGPETKMHVDPKLRS